MSQKICLLKGVLEYETPTGEDRSYVKKTDTYFRIFSKADVISAINSKDEFLFTVYGCPVKWETLLGFDEDLVLTDNGIAKINGKVFNTLDALVDQLKEYDMQDMGLNSEFYQKIINVIKR